MVMSFNKLRKIEQNTVLLPELSLTVQKGDIIAVQCENEYIGRLFTLLNHPEHIQQEAIALPEGGFQNVYLFQQTDGLYKRLNVKQMLLFWCKLYRHQADLEFVLNLCELRHCAAKKTKQLTLSEQQRLLFASALIQEAAVYIFEDPSLGLDLQSKHVLHNLLLHLADKGAAVLLFTPTLEEAIRLGSSVYRYSERGVQQLEQDIEDAENTAEEEPEDEITSMQVQLDKISAKIEDKIILFNPLEIDYIEARDGQTYLFVNNEEFASSNTIKSLEDRLQPLGFFRCHRSYLVNLQWVREIIIWSKNSYSLSLDNPSKSTIPLSKGNYSKLKELIHL
ncbi:MULTISPECIES: LytTR family transcriptional regulator DNA-binding domain-containing protein [Oceanobacillus]|uniref:LytTR family transcriptional regulator DNA-binding domain-containing protein n=2 Tax=Oceanobacillus TaxID=182709 RepID=A0ABV9JY38_9BACI|nr:LytTR family transcriptional regulator DNA-binding domain-containing protein [Oceanobacillus oncorhynchi]MDM8100699.1 LytTR family transcriptional regulator DNA-binding domain-containing protein [Oceanobacillus oncorhynchi]